MRLFLLRLFVLAVLVVPVGVLAVHRGPGILGLETSGIPSSELGEQVLGVADSISNMIFKVSIPARFEDSVTFAKPISAPNLIESLVAGDGIKVDGNKITNTGLLSLTAGDGIEVDGNKIKNTGILSLTAGTNISIDGNKITNTYSYTAPTIDYTLSGWTDNGTSITLTTLTDSVTVGSLTTGAIVADSLTTSGLALAGGLTVTSGNSLMPETDLGSDIGDATHRFNNLWVANINSNSSQSFSGQTTFSYAPTDTTISQASILVNPTTSAANGQLLGLGIGGYQRALIDEDGDIILGYNSATSAPATDYPLDIYGHSGTRVSYVDTSGNGYFAGKIGIGMTNPTYLIDVQGTSHSYINMTAPTGSASAASFNSGSTAYMVVGQNTSTGAGLMVGGSPYGAVVNQQRPYPLEFGTNNAVRMSISSIGLVGIGTTSPTSKLHVTGAVTGKALTIFDETGNQNILTASASGVTKFSIANSGALSVTSNLGSSQSLGTFTNTSASRMYLSVTDNAGASYFGTQNNYTFIGSQNSQSTSNVNISSTGNVGIGTTSPGEKLEISGGRIKSSGNSSSWSTINGIEFDDTYGVGAARRWSISSGSDTAGTLSFRSGTTQTGDPWTSGSTKMIIDSSGNVGIGTTTPGTINGTSYSGGRKMLGLSTSGIGAMVIEGTTSELYMNDSDGTSGARLFQVSNNAGITKFRSLNDSSSTHFELMAFDLATGYVGIGTTSPGASLSFGASTAAAGGILFGGDTNLYRGAADVLYTDDSVNISGYLTMSQQIRALAQISGSSQTLPSYGFSADSNTGIFTPAADAIGFTTNGSEKMRIDSTGSVGIGTISPDRLLHDTVSDSGTNTTVFGQKLEHATSGTAAANFGIGTEYGLEDAAGTRYVAGDTGVRWSGTPTAGSPSSDFIINLLQSGVYYQQALRINSSGYLFLGTDTTSYISHPGSNQIGLVISGYTSLLTTSTATTINLDGQSRAFSVLGASGVNSIYASTAGLVGLGTTSPTSKLHVTGAVTGKALAIFDETGDQNILTASASGTTRMVLTNAGNLGIGTLSPSVPLEVNGLVRIGGSITLNGDSGSRLRSDSTGLISVLTGTGGAYGSLQVGDGSVSLPSLRFGNDTDTGLFSASSNTELGIAVGGSERLRIGSSGNVGIGTTSPTSKLHVSGKTTGKALAIFDETGDQNLLTASASGTTRMVLTSAGRLGLGTIAPTQVLDVNGAITAAFSTYTQNSGQGYFYSNGNWGFSPLAGANRLGITANAAERLSIDSVGSVGIGTITPTSRLHVSGATTGKALAIFDETGDQAILTASASGVTKLTVKRDGNILATSGSTISARSDFSTGLYLSTTDVSIISSNNTSYGAGSGGNHDFAIGGTRYMIIRGSSGFTGIGPDASPDYYFDVQGDLNADSNAYLSSGTGNVGIGGTTFGTNANHVLSISTSTAPTTAITDGIQLYAVDSSGSHELKVMDEAGNATTLSPHNFSLIDDGPSEDMAWSFYSERDGLAVNVDMTKALRIVEGLSGEKLIVMKDLNTGEEIDNGISTTALALTATNTKLDNFIAMLKESITSIKGYFEEIFTKKSHQEELCVGTTDNETCVTKEQLDKLIELIPSPTASASAVPSSTPTPSPTASPAPSLEPSPTSSPSGVQ